MDKQTMMLIENIVVTGLLPDQSYQIQSTSSQQDEILTTRRSNNIIPECSEEDTPVENLRVVPSSLVNVDGGNSTVSLRNTHKFGYCDETPNF
mgnify:CR=1 FL=1